LWRGQWPPSRQNARAKRHCRGDRQTHRTTDRL